MVNNIFIKERNDTHAILIEYRENNKNDINIEENVIQFFNNFYKSFYHGIVFLYHALYYYLIKKKNSKIIIPEMSKKNFYYQFINIFLEDDKIYMINYNKIYKFNNIKIIKNIIYEGNIMNSFEPKIWNKETNKYELKWNRILNNIFIPLEYVNDILKDKIKKNKTCDKVFIYRSNENSIVENNRIFNNYEEIVNNIKKKYDDILIFKPEKYNLRDQISIMMNCSILITDWGSSLVNNLWMKKNSKCYCIVHPWMAYFKNNMSNSTYIYTAEYLKINFNCIFCNTYYNNKLVSEKFIRREKTKKSWNGSSDCDYKYIVDIDKLNMILDKN